jgi:hypothetical protein
LKRNSIWLVQVVGAAWYTQLYTCISQISVFLYLLFYFVIFIIVLINLKNKVVTTASHMFLETRLWKCDLQRSWIHFSYGFVLYSIYLILNDYFFNWFDLDGWSHFDTINICMLNPCISLYLHNYDDSQSIQSLTILVG